MIEINLLGEKHKRESKSSVINIKANWIIMIVVSIFLVEFVSLGVVTYLANSKIDSLKRERDQLNNLENKVRNINRKIKRVQRMIVAVKRLEKNRRKAVVILEEVANSMPSSFFSGYEGGLWLTSLNKKGKTIILTGKSFTAEAVADYMMKLESLKDVEKVRFTSAGLRKIGKNNGIDVYSFAISIKLKG